MLSLIHPQSEALPKILPQGDHWPQGRPRWQFRLRALWCLLTIAAVGLGLAVWIGWGPTQLATLLLAIVVLWWPCARLYDRPERSSTDPAEQEVLREEVRQWQTGHDRPAER